jgi:hypothetical protein
MRTALNIATTGLGERRQSAVLAVMPSERDGTARCGQGGFDGYFGFVAAGLAPGGEHTNKFQRRERRATNSLCRCVAVFAKIALS